MLIIHRVISPEKAKRIRSIWERIGAVKAESKRKAICIERGGKFAFVDKTDNGQNCLSQEKRAELFDLKRLKKWPETYEVRYIQPRGTHLCGASEAWHELWVAVAEENISFSLGDALRRSFLVRTEKDGFLTKIAQGIVDKHGPFDCHCDKAVMMGKIEELLKSVEEIDDDLHQIDNLYADLERLLGLKVSEPSTVLTGKEK